MIERWLHRVALYARRRYRRVFAVSAVLLALAIVSASTLEFDTEVLNLLPQDDPVVVTFRETLEEFGSLDFLLVVMRIPAEAPLDPYLELADEIGPALEQLETIQYVDYRVGDLDALAEQFFPHALLFMEPGELEEVARRLSDAAIEQRTLELRRLLQTPQALALRELTLLDPLGLSDILLERLTSSRGDLNVDWSRGYVLSADRTRLLMLAKPTAPAQEVEFGRRLIQEVNEVVADRLGGWDERAEELEMELEAPEIVLGGTYVIALEDAQFVARDIILGAVTSMLGVMLLFLIAFRRLGLLLYGFLPLSCGLVLAFGFAGVSVGTLNAATSGFAALLVGLGIDFVIVSYGRYVEERGRGARLSTALRNMCGSSGRAVVTGGITTAATFYAFMVTEFDGLRQMGFLIGTGIFFCMGTVLVLLPAMLAWREDHPHGGPLRGLLRRLRRSGGESGKKPPKLYLHGFGSERVIRFSFNHPRLVLTLGLVVTVVSGFLATRLEFVDSIRNMRPEGNRGVEVQDEVSQAFGSGFDYMMLIVSAETELAVRKRTAEVVAEARSLVDSGVLVRVDSVGTILPSPDQQASVLEWVDERRGREIAPARARATFDESARAAGINPAAFSRGLDLLTRAAEVDRPVESKDLRGSAEADRLLDRYLHEKPDGWRSVVYLYPPPRVAKRQAPPEVEALAEALGPDVVLSGVNTVSARLRELVKSDAVVAAVVGFVLVALLLWIDYRKPFDTALSLSPLVVGIVWMLGAMAVVGIDMNFFNVFVSTMIIGIGVDYGVHMIHRYREEQNSGKLLEGLEETGKAIILAALSTSVGFGSMSLSHYPGLRSMGLVAIMGALATAVVAVTLLPALMGLRDPASITEGSSSQRRFD